MAQGEVPKWILLSWSLKYEVHKWGKTVGMGKMGKREELLSWKTKSWKTKGVEKEVQKEGGDGGLKRDE